MKVWDWAGIELPTPGSAVRHVSAVRHIIDCAMPPIFHSVLLWCKIAKKGECSALLWSFNFLSKLMPAANCILLIFEVDEGCLPHDENERITTFSFSCYFTGLKH